MTEKRSNRETITKDQFNQLVGLLALAEKYSTFLKDIEQSALEITQEIGHDGELYAPWDGSLTGDTIHGGHTVKELLKHLGIKVK